MVTKKLIYLFFIMFISMNINASIIYEKNNKIVTDIDVEIYKQLYKENYRSEINDKNALKDLILIKGVIEDLIKKNPDFIKKIDKEIMKQFGAKTMENENIKEFLRFSKIRDEFIINYFQNELKVEEIKNIFKNLENLNLPISDNNCLLIKEIINLQNNTEFIENFFNNLKNDSNEFVITLNKKKYSVCLDQKTFKSIEKLIVEYIQMQTKEEFEKFVYGKTSN
tara:strand:- start:448 stop:1119 length:672 start_codon:yes stop_codon:yes gene_type:complete